MTRVVAVVIGIAGAWFFVPGLASRFGSPGEAAPVPAMETSTVLGLLLLLAAVLPWRRRATVSAGHSAADAAADPVPLARPGDEDVRRTRSDA